MDDKLKTKLTNLLKELSKAGVETVVLLKENNNITWLGNVPREVADAIAIKVGSDLKKLRRDMKDDNHPPHLH